MQTVFVLKEVYVLLRFPVSSWQKIKNSGKPVLIYGMGNGADKVIDELNRLEIPIIGVTASDAFVRGQMFRGFTVRKLSEFEGDFIIAVSFASCIPEVVEHIYSLSERYEVLVPCVPVIGNEIINEEFIEKYKDKIVQAHSLFKGRSQSIFEGCVEFMLSGDLDVLKSVTTDKEEVFENILKLSEDELYLDLGAYRGDTIDEFLSHTDGKYSEIIALEPDRKTFRKLSDHVSEMENVSIFQKAVSSDNSTASFNSAAGRQSSLSSDGEKVETVTVDTLCENKAVTYIKMDVEGSEIDALIGAGKTLSEKKPKLNIALYHKFSDLFEIPLLIKSINPDYEFHIRRHPYIPCWDMNLYCI